MNDDRFGIAGYTSSTYGDAFADVYDEWYSSLSDSDFVEFIATLLPDRPATILELGVGTGRLLEQLVPMRSHPDIVYGIDSSGAMLNKFTGRVNLQHVTVMQADFSLTLPEATFDLIFVGYNTLFNLPDDDSLAACFSLINDRLSPDGVFALDVVVPEPASSPEVVTVKSMRADGVTLSVSSHDHEQQRITGQFIDITNENGVKLRPWSVRYWTPAQLDSHARQAGLTLVNRIADGNGAVHDEDDARHISVYTRQRD